MERNISGRSSRNKGLGRAWGGGGGWGFGGWEVGSSVGVIPGNTEIGMQETGTLGWWGQCDRRTEAKSGWILQAILQTFL